MITAFASTETAVEAMRLGACDYLSKPFDIDLLKMKVREKIENRQLRQENVLLKRTLGLSHQFSNIIGRSEAMLDVFKMIETVARTNSTILLTGESGTGKGLVAQAIHFHSLRRDKPMVSLNCGAMPETLLESELFGHMRGAFTGADANKKGLLEVAEKGTIFLDEIGEMSAVMQVKLLRVLQERRFRRVGGLEELQADIRVIAATNQDLTKAVAEGRFREDLFYRINVIPIALPPLRERREDIPLLAEHFLAKYAEQMGKADHRHLARGDGAAACSTTGPATSASSRTSSSGRWPSRRRRRSCPTACRRRSAATAPQRRRRAADALPEAGFDLEAHVKEIERGYIAAGAEAGRRRAGEGGGAARHELPVVPLLREEIQPAVTAGVPMRPRRSWSCDWTSALAPRRCRDVTICSPPFRSPTTTSCSFRTSVDAGLHPVPSARSRGGRRKSRRTLRDRAPSHSGRGSATR